MTRSFNEDNICFIDFFHVANDDDPFFTQFCQKDDDPEVCGHKNLHVLFEVDQICAFCKAKYVASKEKEDWLHIICVNNGFSIDASRNNILL